MPVSKFGDQILTGTPLEICRKYNDLAKTAKYEDKEWFLQQAEHWGRTHRLILKERKKNDD